MPGCCLCQPLIATVRFLTSGTGIAGISISERISGLLSVCTRCCLAACLSLPSQPRGFYPVGTVLTLLATCDRHTRSASRVMARPEHIVHA